MTMNGTSSVAEQDGVWNEGALTMHDQSSIYGAHITGGVYSTGTLSMHGQSSIHDNSSGGGWFNAGGRAVACTTRAPSRCTTPAASMTTVSSGPRLAAPGGWGGLYNASGGTLVGVNCAPHTYANVYGNTPDDCYFEP